MSRIMILTINIPDPPKNQCLIDISLHFLDGQLVEYTVPSGWVIKEQPKIEKLLPCTCGSNMRHLWMNTTPGELDKFRKEKEMTREEILNKAKECVCGQREQDYGTPEDNFLCIANLWNDYLYSGLSFEEVPKYLTPTDVAMMMALLKVARIRNGGGTGDSFVDMAGYAACGGELCTKGKKDNRWGLDDDDKK